MLFYLVRRRQDCRLEWAPQQAHLGKGFGQIAGRHLGRLKLADRSIETAFPWRKGDR